MKTKITSLLFLMVSFVSQNMNSQTEQCSTSEMNQQLFDSNPQLYADYLKENERLAAIDKAAYANGYKDNSRAAGVVYTYPVVFHIIHNGGTENISDAQIKDAFRILQEDFRKLNSSFSTTAAAFKPIAADCEIEFFLATKDPSGNPTTGIVRTVSTKTNAGTGGNDAKIGAWPTNKYINIWIVKSLPGGSSGFTYYPTNTVGSLTDGPVLISTYTGSIGTSQALRGSDITHEMGHYFNLWHIWGQGGNCGDDGVSDTPISKQHNWIQNNCQTNDKSCPDGKLQNSQNFMDYSFCYTMFTEGQKTRMLSSVTGSNSRNTQWQTANLIAAGYTSVGLNDEPPYSINFKVYPNPLEENSMIKFNLIEKQKVDLKIYDVTGREVESVFQGDLSTGEHQYSIGNNTSLSSGIYFIKLTVGNEQFTKKMIIKQ